MSKRFRRTLVVLGLLACWTMPAYAAWMVNAETSASFSSGTLQPPTGLTVSRECSGEGLADYTLEWMPSASLYAEGYTLRRYADGAPDGMWVITPASAAVEIQTDVSVDPGDFTYSWELEAFSGSWSSAAATASDVVETPPPCTTAPSEALHVEYQTTYTASTSNTIGPQLRIHNTGTSPVPLSELTVRYWFTREGTAALNYACDWAQMGCANITGAFSQLGTPVAGADHYLQLSFGGGAGSVAAGGNSGEIHSRFHKVDWSNFNQADDWSFDATKTSYAQWDRVTLYRNGTLVWGTEPSGSGGDTTPPAAPTGLVATATSSSAISLDWADNPEPDLASYNVYRSTTPGFGPGPSTLVASGVTASSYSDSGLAAATTYYYLVTAVDTSSNESDPSAEASATTSAATALSLQYRDADGDPANSVIMPQFIIVNSGAGAVPLSELTVRYWFTREGTSNLQHNCDWAQVGCGNITRSMVQLSPARPGATHYLQLTFTAGAGSISAGSTSGEIHTRFNKANNSNFDETDDWSYRANTPSFVQWDRVTVYRNGVLVWGVEP